MYIILHRKQFYILSIILIVLSIGAMIGFGFNVGIDFKGGSIISVTYTDGRPDQDAIQTSLDKLSLGTFSLRPSGEREYVLRSRELTQDEKNGVIKALSLNDTVKLEANQFNSIGPSVGKELARKAYIAIAIVILGIVLFITFAFRKVSEPVSSWKYGMTTVVGLIHDVIVPAGFFIVVSHYTGGEVDLLFVTALLAILGYSVHDKIVVFDRVRENLRISKEGRKKIDFEMTVGESISQTLGRSINTSLTIFLVLVALYFIGSPSTKDFTLVLLVGVIIGTYSSIFVASPLLVTLEKLQKRS